MNAPGPDGGTHQEEAGNNHHTPSTQDRSPSAEGGGDASVRSASPTTPAGGSRLPPEVPRLHPAGGRCGSGHPQSTGRRYHKQANILGFAGTG